MDFLQAKFDDSNLPINSIDQIRHIRFHANGPIYNQIEIEGSESGLLLISPKYKHWNVEMAADVFAAHACILASPSGTPLASNLDHWVSCLSLWQLALLSLGFRQEYVRAVSNQPDSTHPSAHVRMDVLIHHINHFAETYAPEWRSETITIFRKQYELMWQPEMLELIHDGIEYVRYGFDGEGPDINPGKVRSFAKGMPVPTIPSALEKLRRYFLEPFLKRVDIVGWDGAIRESEKEHREYLSTFQLNSEPIILKIGLALYNVGLRLT
jgi:hypothetical protein